MKTVKNINNKQKGKFTLRIGGEIYLDANCNPVLFSVSEVNKFVSASLNDRKLRNGLRGFTPSATIKLIGDSWTYSATWW
ncbi:MAG: hypothetical protein ACPGUE_11155 [Marinomonas sp.]